MMVPQGGFQSNRKGDALWEDHSNQERLKALWKEIADRYKDEIIIAAFDLVNEPVTTSSVDQWKQLAQEIINEIRSVDPNHLIIVEKLLGIDGQWVTYNDTKNQFLVNDYNVMYQFHSYYPGEYTHQNFQPTGLGDGGKYPDLNTYQFPSDSMWHTAIFNNPNAPAGDSPWTYYQGIKYRVKDPKITAARPVYFCESNSGTVYFDDFVIKEYNNDKVFIKEILIYNIDATNGSNWDFWSKDGRGSWGLSVTEGNNDNYSMYMSVKSSGALTNMNLRFKVKVGNYYQINGFLKGESINRGAKCNIRLDFETSPSGGVVVKRNKEALEAEFLKWLQFGLKHKVPMYVGEFGVYRDCFENNKGGLNWVTDMLDILEKYNLHYTYHTYHESPFGIYQNDGDLPNLLYANRELINLFTKQLKF